MTLATFLALQSHQPADKWADAFPLDPHPQSFGRLMNKESTYLGATVWSG